MKVWTSLAAIVAVPLAACAPTQTPNDPAERARVDALIERLVQHLRSIQKSG